MQSRFFRVKSMLTLSHIIIATIVALTGLYLASAIEAAPIYSSSGVSTAESVASALDDRH